MIFNMPIGIISVALGLISAALVSVSWSKHQNALRRNCVFWEEKCKFLQEENLKLKKKNEEK